MKKRHRVIIITGASDGIGAEMARQLACKYKGDLGLVLAARNEEALHDVAADCKLFGTVCLVVRTDVGSEPDCRRLIRATIEAFGSIDCLINNAGKSAQALFSDVENLGWYQELMRINFWGSVWCTHAALPYLKETRGNIVAVSSLAGLIGVPGRTAYSASKFAMNGFFESLRSEISDTGVHVTLAISRRSRQPTASLLRPETPARSRRQASPSSTHGLRCKYAQAQAEFAPVSFYRG